MRGDGGMTAASAWREIATRWTRYAPPARPSAGDVSHMKRGLRRLIQARTAHGDEQLDVLLLGSTPELRDMLAEFPEVRVTLIDCELSMMKAMTELMTAKPLGEVWVEGDWLAAPLLIGHYDAVLSDLVLGNIDPAGQAKLILRVHDLLKPSGRWLTRVDCVDEHSAFVGLETLLAYYASIPEPSKEEICALRSVAGIQYWDAASGFHSYAALGDAMKKFREDDRFIHPDPSVNAVLGRLWEVCVPLERPYWLLRREVLISELDKYFQVEQEIRSEWQGLYQGRGYYYYDLAPRRSPT